MLSISDAFLNTNQCTIWYVMKCKKKNTRIFIKLKEDMTIKWKHHETSTQLNVNSDVYKYMNIYVFKIMDPTKIFLRLFLFINQLEIVHKLCIFALKYVIWLWMLNLTIMNACLYTTLNLLFITQEDKTFDISSISEYIDHLTTEN